VPAPGQLQDLASADGEAYRAALERFRRAGGTFVEVDVTPLLAAARLLYEGPWVAERTAVVQPLLETRPGAIHPIVRTIVQAGRGISAVDAFKGFYALQEYVRDAEELWQRIDVLALPTTPSIYRREEVLAEPYALNANLGRYTNFVNLLDMCAVSIPAGFRENGTGVGVSLIGPAWSDTTLLNLAARYAKVPAPYAVPKLDTREDRTHVRLAVVGAHLSGMPLHAQLTSRGARLVQRTHTAPLYRLFSLQGETPPKPALVHCGAAGRSIELEVYELEVAAFGSFVAEVPPPLAIGTVTLSDGSNVRGFVCESRAVTGALDITEYGGWRPYLAHSKRSTS
jgi:allophanate hydrolase